jgi:hypothetical protein
MSGGKAVSPTVEAVRHDSQVCARQVRRDGCRREGLDVGVRLLDLEKFVVKRLGELPYAAYLCSMCVIAAEIRAAYFGLLSANGRVLSSQTIDVAGRAARSGASRGNDRHRELFGAWQRLIADPAEDGPAGWFAAVYTFRDLAGEIAGERAPWAALEWVTGTAADLPEAEPTDSGPRLVGITLREEVSEDSPTVQMLRNFEQVAGFAAELAQQERPCDPDAIRSAVIGQMGARAEADPEA